ncbi:hypothetical protein O1611_g507 [Lasiodiplodia mahajangana]|uniref:Uncharacterized protein n=1 Tax=Lasiodiplodia mahajangana TaxID=1108764 RepID=A0ACC2K0P7_9PEZI|nr:hypothetical protein O1611_g507 [Lasiodiplodia mahajangana]
MECPSCGYASQSAPLDVESASRTHDASATSYHIPLPDWLAQLNQAIHSAWPKRFVGYAEVAVLMLCWKETYEGAMRTENCRLASVFSSVYNYSVSRWLIPSNDPDLAIFDRVGRFLEEYGHPENLLIVYYGGHARHNPAGGNFPIWQPRSESERGKQIDTAIFHPLLVRAKDDSPDVLLLYDCCFPLASYRANSNNSRAEVEGLFAGGFESKVPIPGQNSFTNHLTDVLATAPGSGRTLTIAELHRQIIVRLQSFHEQSIFDANHEIRRCEITGKVLHTKSVRVTPSHSFLAGNEKPRLIALRPLNNGQVKSEDTVAIESKASEWPKVLLGVRLLDDGCVEQEFRDWILQAPPDQDRETSSNRSAYWGEQRPPDLNEATETDPKQGATLLTARLPSLTLSEENLKSPSDPRRVLFAAQTTTQRPLVHLLDRADFHARQIIREGSRLNSLFTWNFNPEADPSHRPATNPTTAFSTIRDSEVGGDTRTEEEYQENFAFKGENNSDPDVASHGGPSCSTHVGISSRAEQGIDADQYPIGEHYPASHDPRPLRSPQNTIPTATEDPVNERFCVHQSSKFQPGEIILTLLIIMSPISSYAEKAKSSLRALGQGLSGRSLTSPRQQLFLRAYHAPRKSLGPVPHLRAPTLASSTQSQHTLDVSEHLRKSGILKVTLGFPDKESRYLEQIIRSLHSRHGHKLPISHSASRGWFWDVRPSSTNFQTANHQARSETMSQFPWHTDCSYENPTPRYFALHVLQHDQFGGGTLSIMNVGKLIERLSPAAREALKGDEYRIVTPPEFIKDANAKPIITSVLSSDSEGKQIIRFRDDIIKPLSENAANAFQELLQALPAAATDPQTTMHLTAKDLPKQSVLMLDNRRWLHSRNVVKDPSRHLRRVRWDAIQFD